MSRRRIGKVTLAMAVLALAAFLRFDGLGAPSYWLDEILGDELTTKAAAAPWWHWITGLEREHGPLYYATQLAARLAGRDEAAGRLPAALFGLATIPLVALAARRRPGGWPGGVPPAAAAILLAASPLHVYYSREARPYALLMLFTAALLVAILHSRVRLGALLIVLMLYTTAVAGPLLAAVAVTAATAALLRRERGDVVLAVLAAAAAALVPLLYRGPSQAAADAAKLDAKLAMTLVRSFTVSARGVDGHTAAAVLLIAMAVWGAVDLARRDRRDATIVIGFTVLPMATALASLAAIGHWFAVRYVSPALIGFVVLAGIGIAAVGRLLGSARLGGAVSIVLAALIAGDTFAAARREPLDKLDWRAIGATLARHVKPGDYVVAAGPWSSVCLRYYLRDLPPRVKLAGVDNVTVAEMLFYDAPVWYVTGDADDTPVHGWTCNQPLLLAGRLDGVRVHYAPLLRLFVRRRATAEDLRALAAGLGPHVALQAGRDDEAMRGEGWSDGEGGPGQEFRWAIEREATLELPRLAPAHRRVGFNALPLVAPSLPPQVVRVSVNGTVIGETPMAAAWGDYAFDAPASLWREGVNTIAFFFSRATAPAALGGSTDRRTLAAAFQRFAIDDVGDATPALRPSLAVRFASDALFFTRVRPRSRRTRLPVETLDRRAVETLLGRLGFDPRTAWPHLARGEVFLEDVAASIAYESGCEDDRAFLDRAFATLLGRRPNPGEQSDLGARLRTGATRDAIVDRILRAQDFRPVIRADGEGPPTQLRGGSFASLRMTGWRRGGVNAAIYHSPIKETLIDRSADAPANRYFAVCESGTAVRWSGSATIGQPDAAR